MAVVLGGKIIIMKKILCVLMTMIIFIAGMPQINVHAQVSFTVTVKKGQCFYVGKEITQNMFDIECNNQILTNANVEITPSQIDEAGKHTVNIKYQDNSAWYNANVEITVLDNNITDLEVGTSDVTVVDRQEVTQAALPMVYLVYNDGTKKATNDYKFEIDWERSKCKISYGTIVKTIDITVKPNELASIDVSCTRTSIKENETFSLSDIIVVAHYNNGSSKVITNGITILPYSLVAGRTARITVKYENVSDYFQINVIAADNAINNTENTATPNSTNSTNSTNTATPVVTVAPTNTPVVTTVPTATPNSTNSANGTNTATQTNNNATSAKIEFYADFTSVKIGVGEKVKLNCVAKVNGEKAALTYVSKNRKIAKVDSNGTVTGIGTGSTTVVISFANEKRKVKITTMKKPSQVSFNMKLKKTVENNVKVNDRIQLRIWFPKSSYSHKITFATNNSKIATVNKKGLVVTYKKGTCLVRGKTYNGKVCYIKLNVK